MSFFISSRGLLWSILSSQTDPPTLKNADFPVAILTFLKNQRFRSKDGFESVWGLSRAPLGSSWEVLGSSFGPLDRPKKASRFALELSWASFARFLLPNMACGASMSFFDSSRSLLGSILSSQTDHPTLQIVDFTMRILTFLKNQRFRSKDGFESVLGLSRAPFGSSWGSLGSSFGLLDRPKRASRFVLELSWASFACFVLPKVALGKLWGCIWLVLSPLGASWGRF